MEPKGAKTHGAVKEGFVKRRRDNGLGYEDRLLHLQGAALSYSNSRNELKQYHLSSSCKVSQITQLVHGGKKLYAFELTWPAAQSAPLALDARDDTGIFGELLLPDAAAHGTGPPSGTQTALRVGGLALGAVVLGSLTAGVGLLAGLLVVGLGAAAGGGVVALEMQPAAPKPDSLAIACEGVEDAKAWLVAIKSQIDDLISQRNASEDSSARTPGTVDVLEIEGWIGSSKWVASAVHDGYRIYTLPSEEGRKAGWLGALGSSVYSPFPVQRISIPINASPVQVYETIREFPAACCSGVVRALRVVQTLDRHSDVVHLQLNAVFLAPTWTAPRDFCLMRFAKQNADGSFIVCLDTVAHPDCPPVDGFIRAELHAVYVIAPPRQQEAEADGSAIYMESLLTFIAQLDARGWVWRAAGYQDALLTQLLLHLVDLRDCLDEERFVQISLENATSSFTGAPAEKSEKKKEGDWVGNCPEPSVPLSMWKEPDASTFRLRSKTYNVDKFKCNSAPSLFRLAAIDMFEVPDNIQNIAMHPKNRVFQSLQREENIWVFVVNIMVPGPPFYNFVAYMVGDKKLIEEDTPFGRVAKPFFLGNDDEFRRNRFKLIPKIVEGNMVIKLAVKDTPTLLGNKIKNYYYRGDNYFEIDVDAGSSSVARNVIGLAIGYAKSIVVDMGFCLQGNEEDELPEVLMGCCRCVNVDMTLAPKLE